MADDLEAKLAAAQEDLLNLHREVVRNIVAASRCEEMFTQNMQQRALLYSELSRKFANPDLKSALAAIADDEASVVELMKSLPEK